jgi:hypothetical protein
MSVVSWRIRGAGKGPSATHGLWPSLGCVVHERAPAWSGQSGPGPFPAVPASGHRPYPSSASLCSTATGPALVTSFRWSTGGGQLAQPAISLRCTTPNRHNYRDKNRHRHRHKHFLGRLRAQNPGQSPGQDLIRDWESSRAPGGPWTSDGTDPYCGVGLDQNLDAILDPVAVKAGVGPRSSVSTLNRILSLMLVPSTAGSNAVPRPWAGCVPATADCACVGPSAAAAHPPGAMASTPRGAGPVAVLPLVVLRCGGPLGSWTARGRATPISTPFAQHHRSPTCSSPSTSNASHHGSHVDLPIPPSTRPHQPTSLATHDGHSRLRPSLGTVTTSATVISLSATVGSLAPPEMSGTAAEGFVAGRVRQVPELAPRGLDGPGFGRRWPGTSSADGWPTEVPSRAHRDVRMSPRDTVRPVSDESPDPLVGLPPALVDVLTSTPVEDKVLAELAVG